MIENTIQLAPYLAALSLLYFLAVIVYRWHFHPLAHFPGPPLAITTYLYEWYFDLYLKGQYTFRLRSLHKQYGKLPEKQSRRLLKLRLNDRAHHKDQSK